MGFKFEPTGEVRPPMAGEWFIGYGGAAKQAIFDFQCESFAIVKASVTTDGGKEISL